MQRRTLLRRVLRRVLETPFEKVLRRVLRFLEGALQWVLMGRRVLRRVLRRGSKKGLSRRHLEGRSTPFREYGPLGVCPIKEPSKNPSKSRVRLHDPLDVRPIQRTYVWTDPFCLVFKENLALKLYLSSPPPRKNYENNSPRIFLCNLGGATTVKLRNYQEIHSPRIILRNWQLQRPQTLPC